MPVSPVGLTANQITANTLPITKQAQGYFLDHVASLNQILSQVEQARQACLDGAVKSPSASMWGESVAQWEVPFQKIIADCQWMSDMLGKTVQDLENNENNNAALVKAIQQEVIAETNAPPP
jgi:hypothetical protein